MHKEDIKSAIDGGSLQADFYGYLSSEAESGGASEFIAWFTKNLAELEEEGVITGTSDALVDGKLDPEFLGDIYLS